MRPKYTIDTEDDRLRMQCEHDCWLRDVQRWSSEWLTACRTLGRDPLPELPGTGLPPRVFDAHRRRIVCHRKAIAGESAPGVRRGSAPPKPDDWLETHHRERLLHERLRREHEGLLNTLLQGRAMVY